MNERRPLSDLLVLDLSRVLAGPFAAMMLADLGARVIKVERPGGGDDSRSFGPFHEGRSAYFGRLNRGKESIALDLRDDADRELLFALVERADVLIENFRPGVMARLGLSYDVLSARNPRLIYCSVSGFGQTGPWSAKPAYDAVVQGLSGIMNITGQPTDPPIKPGIPVADLAGGLFGFAGIMAALHARHSTGRGDCVDVAMHDGILALLESAALHTLTNGVDPERIGNAHYSIAPFDSFTCADGLITICAGNDSLFASLAVALLAPELLDDPRFVSNATRYAHRSALTEIINEHLSTGPKAQWLEKLTAAGVPCGNVATVHEAVTSEQTRQRHMVIEAEGMKLPGNPIKMSTLPDGPTMAREPYVDEHGDMIRAWLSALGEH